MFEKNIELSTLSKQEHRKPFSRQITSGEKNKKKTLVHMRSREKRLHHFDHYRNVYLKKKIPENKKHTNRIKGNLGKKTSKLSFSRGTPKTASDTRRKHTCCFLTAEQNSAEALLSISTYFQTFYVALISFL